MNNQSKNELEKRNEMLQKVAQQSLSEFGLEGGIVTLLQDYVNSSFRVQRDNHHWYLRIYNPDRHDISFVESELIWMEALADEGFPVPRPLKTHNQSLFWETPKEDLKKKYIIAYWTWIEGSIVPNDQRNPDHFYIVGSMLSRLHNFSINWAFPKGFQRPQCDSGGVYGTLGIIGKRIESAWESVSEQLRSDLKGARDALQQIELAIGKDSRRYGLVHGDPSFGNILFNDNSPFLIDFDDSGFGYLMSDLAVVLAGAWGKPGFEERRSSLLCGYQKNRNLSDEEISALPFAMAARAASLIFWYAIQSPQHPWIEGQWKRLKEYIK